MDDLLIRSRRTVLPDGEHPAAVSIRDGRITAISGYSDDRPATASVDLGDVALLPGLVDTHVHINEPGRTEWEGFATATRAAAAGGVTTLIDMPLNSLPPTVGPAALAAKREAAEGACAVDVGFWGGAVPGNRAELRPLHDLGVFGFKCFTSDSGVPEFPPLPYGEMREAFREIASFGGLVIVHAEDPAALSAPTGGGYPEFLASRPPSAERRAVEQVVRLAEETGVRAHILHLSAADCLDVLAKAQADGLPITAETCPHYLTLSAEDASGAYLGGDPQIPGVRSPEPLASLRSPATAFKCCPPIRDAANRDRLWEGLASGVISCVVTDHSPCTPELKRGDFATAWGGISSLQLGLPVVWTAARERGHGLDDVVRWMSEAPAALAGVPGKGGIVVGNDADLVAFAPDATLTVDPAALHHRHPVTPYAGRTLAGAVETTWLRGVPAGERPAGRLLAREAR
ncbi:amidohydrolase family protein [Actinomadura bangladeshensis]|uniref:Allantoinase n=1 Tax=Actinomadura bangladeshensis TaxID=453573 RepID=A0A4R4P600_9ACTN|nr:amidohydrolase family protein [Actinomadura bangladeshensis]TDC17505.1 allantoinase [Actinomadura bangladeshensis]